MQTTSPNAYSDKITYKSPHSKHLFSKSIKKGMRTFERVINLNDKIIFEAIKQKQHKNAINLFNQLHTMIQKSDYSANKKQYFNHSSIYYYNRAALYHINQQNQQCVKYLEKAIQNFQIMIGYARCREQIVSFNVEYSKMLIQLCAVLSQCSKHKQGIVYAEKSLNKLIQSFRILHAICHQNLLIHTDSQTTQASFQDNQKCDKVDFKKIIIKQAESKLSQLSNLPSIHKLIVENKQYYEGIMYEVFNFSKNIYFWRDNVENNEKILRKQLDLETKTNSRNILGINKNSTSAEDLHIGMLMRLKPKKIQCQIISDRYFLLSSQKILQMVIHCSICYFTIATQTRFSELKHDLDSMKINEKYKKLHKDETIGKCKLLHIKAIEIAAKYLPPSNFFVNHLLGSFNKNYKTVLDQIRQQSEITLKNIQQEQQASDVSSEYGLVKTGQFAANALKVTKKRSKTMNKSRTKSQTRLFKKSVKQ